MVALLLFRTPLLYRTLAVVVLLLFRLVAILVILVLSSVKAFVPDVKLELQVVAPVAVAATAVIS